MFGTVVRLSDMRKTAIVGDAAHTRDFLCYVLRDDYEVLTYESSEDAQNHLPQDSPDLIIMDIRIRDIDGMAVPECIRSDVRLASVPSSLLLRTSCISHIGTEIHTGRNPPTKSPIPGKLAAGAVNRPPYNGNSGFA
jgi:DNA-binding NtrC family response regulator